MISCLWVIYRKELIDTLRDRKTLIFMLLIPTLATPGLIAGMNELVQSLQRRTAVEVVRIAASPQSQAAYVRLVHDWFLGTETSRGLRVATSPLVWSLLRPEHGAQLDAVPQEIFEDPAAFAEWARGLAARMRAGVDSEDRPPPGATGADVPREAWEQALEFYRVVLKGLGLIEFTAPPRGAAPDAAESADRTVLPAAIRSHPHADAIVSAIRSRAIAGYLDVPPTVAGLADDGRASADVTFVYDSTVRLSDEARSRVAYLIERARDRIVRRRLAARDLDASFLEPLAMTPQTDLASESQRALTYIGGILPYFVIAFAFLGGMYPAIDLGAGEKERNTLETLILSPASRTQLAVGKFLVILTTALTAAFLGLISIALSVRYLAPEALLSELDLRIEPTTAVLVGLLSIPPAAAFAGLFLAISIAARSFKEAQNYMAPLQFVLILPAIAPMLPGMEMSWRLACIPLVNVSMLSRDFLKGETNWAYYGLTFGSCALFAAACVAFAVRQFRREEVLFRS